MHLFRVFPWVRGARRAAPGHALFVPPVQGAGRVDNPRHYRTLYASDAAAGAVAETFGNHALWTEALFQGRPDLPGSRPALAELVGPDLRVVDLDDPRELTARRLRPSRVVSRDRDVTQAWALDLFRERAWSGARWWSYWDSRWGAHGLWDVACLRVRRTVPLDRSHPAVVAAAAILSRRIA